MMASEWRTAKLGELVSFKTGKLDSNAAVPNGDYPFFTCSQDTLRTNTYSFDTECVLLGGNNANGIFPLKYFHGKFDAYQRTYIVKPRDSDQLTTKFLYYALRPKLSELRSFSTGAATKFLTLTILNETAIEIPSIAEQRRIAGILSAYDEQIENNQRRIRILEDMAHSLYREWFVHFRYPGHETVPLVDSPLGQIPQGWEVKKIAELLAKVSRQGKIKTQDYLQAGELPVIDQGRELVGGYTNDADVEYSGELPVIVFGDHTRILKFIDFPFVCGADGTQLLRSNDKRMPVSLFYYALSAIELSDFAYARHFKFLKEELVVVPIAELATAFSERVDPIKRQVRILQQQSDNLRRTRDLLLPRLLSGGINIQVTNQEQCHV